MAITRAQQVRQMLRDGGTMEDIGFSIVKPPKDGSRPGYRRSNYDGTGGGLADSSNDPGRSQGPGDRDGGGSTYQETQQKIKEVENRRAAEDREKARIAEQTKIAKQTAENKAKREKFLADQKKERERVEKEKRREKIISYAKNIPTPLNLAKKIFDPVITKNSIAQRKNYLDYLSRTDPKKFQELSKELVDQDLATADMLDTDASITSPSQRFGATDFTSKSLNVNEERFGDGDVKDVLGTGYTDYLNRFNSDNTGGGGDGITSSTIIPTKIPIAENVEEVVEEVVPSRNFGGLAPRFAGSIFDFTGLADGGIARAGAMDGGRMMMMANEEEDDPTGGIMDLESVRDMYFVGGLVKSAKKAVKGVTRAVKKIAKSPIGKAALGFAAYKLGGGFLKGKGLMGTLFGQAGSRVGQPFIPFKEGFLTKLGLTKGGGSLMPTALGGILGATALTGALTPEEEEENNDDYYASNTIDYRNVRNNPFKFLSARNQGSRFAADGGLMRTGYAEGSEEPVAKKTMPLLDMDGQEMDLREEGGFVPLGRMERADDVPARLSKNEFVFTADAVRNAGEGDIDKGAEVMYNMMKNLESGGEVSQESQGLEGAREMFQTSKRLEEVI